jgi:hypothetical protein
MRVLEPYVNGRRHPTTVLELQDITLGSRGVRIPEVSVTEEMASNGSDMEKYFLTQVKLYYCNNNMSDMPNMNPTVDGPRLSPTST